MAKRARQLISNRSISGLSPDGFTSPGISGGVTGTGAVSGKRIPGIEGFVPERTAVDDALEVPDPTRQGRASTVIGGEDAARRKRLGLEEDPNELGGLLQRVLIGS